MRNDANLGRQPGQAGAGEVGLGNSGEAEMMDEIAPLDGNAAAGALGRFFAADVTRIIVTCAHCGATAPLAELHLYGVPMGIILRCPACGEVNLRALEIGPALRLDACGAAYLTLVAG